MAEGSCGWDCLRNDRVEKTDWDLLSYIRGQQRLILLKKQQELSKITF